MNVSLSSLSRVAPLLGALLALSGCGGGESDLSPQDQLLADIDEYESLRATLEGHRTEALGKSATEANGIGSRLFYLDFATFDPTLHSIDTNTGAKVHYKFSIGTGDRYNYRASDQIVVTAIAGFSGVDYNIYAPDQTEALVGQFSTEAPGSGVRWYAYAPDGNMVYIVKESAGGNELLRYTLGGSQLEHVLYLEETGMTVGEFWDFGVEGDTAIMIESGRIWDVKISTKKATWLENETLATAAQWDQQGVFYLTAKSPLFYAYETQKNRDLAKEIELSGYQLNETYDSIHYYYQDGTRLGNDFAYIGRDGLFLFDLTTKKTRPVLLNARDNSIVYRYPTLLENKKLYVQGLESSSGATGADGGWYEVSY